jgi:hypothetical protein
MKLLGLRNAGLVRSQLDKGLNVINVLLCHMAVNSIPVLPKIAL